MVAHEIPLISKSPETLQITLSGVSYFLLVSWNVANAAWTLDLFDANNVLVLSGIPLVTGIDLLDPFKYLNLGGRLFVQTDHNTEAVPTFANLGSQSHLYFVTEQ